MMGGPRPPGDLWYRLAIAAAAAIALLTGGFFFRTKSRAQGFASLPEVMRRELAVLMPSRNATSEIEQKWVARLDRAGWFLAPVGPGTCPGAESAFGYSTAAREAIGLQNSGDRPARLDRLRVLYELDDSNLMALVYGTDLIHANRFSAAAQLLRRKSNASLPDIRRLLDIARNSQRGLDLNNTYVSTLIHLLHAHGVAELKQPGVGAPWDSLKNAIGIVQAVTDRRTVGHSIGDPTWSPLPIHAPGCGQSPDSLSSHDLYNNLIYAYMTEKYVPAGTPQDQKEAREKEFAPAKHNSDGPVRRLYERELARAKAESWKDEYKVWALSNVEQILGWGLPEDARLGVNVIGVIEDTAVNCDEPWCAELEPLKDALLEQALQRASDVTADQQAEFARVATRLLAQSSRDRSRVEPYLETIRGWMPKGEVEVLDSIRRAEQHRRALPRWLVGLSEREVPADAWRSAAEVDFVDAAAVWAVDKSPETQERIIIASRQLLAGRPAPAALQELEGKHDARWLRLQASPWFWTGVAAMIALAMFWVFLWIIVARRDHQMLRASFYNVELEYLRASAPPPRRRGAQ